MFPVSNILRQKWGELSALVFKLEGGYSTLSAHQNSGCFPNSNLVCWCSQVYVFTCLVCKESEEIGFGDTVVLKFLFFLVKEFSDELFLGNNSFLHPSLEGRRTVLKSCPYIWFIESTQISHINHCSCRVCFLILPSFLLFVTPKWALSSTPFSVLSWTLFIL